MRVSNGYLTGTFDEREDYSTAVLESSALPEFSFEGVLDDVASGLFVAASYLTDPVCRVREFYWSVQTVDALNPEAYAISNAVRKAALGAGIVGWASLALFTTLPGIALRSLAAYLQKNPFIYVHGDAQDKTLPLDGSFSLLSWNICCVCAGYSISDGGVVPWEQRIDAIIDKILDTNADVNCLYETFDAKSAFYIAERLKQKGYNHIYFNIGPRAIGVSSGILIASKYKIAGVEFTPFPQDALVGRTKNASKGIFAFDLESCGESFARIHSTHLQHSEESLFPTEEEVEARKKEMQIMMDKVCAVRDRCIVVTGDLNLDDDEYNSSSWQHYFQKGDAYYDPDRTWGGNEFFALLKGERVSGPLNLDHTMILNGTARSISTSLVRTGFNAAMYQPEALSDHEGLLSIIRV